MLHKTLTELAIEFNWEIEVFYKAYENVLKSNFKYEKEYPLRHSKDRKKRGQVILRKDETYSKVFIKLFIENEVLEAILFEKYNLYPDNVDLMAKKIKWMDNYRFGVLGKKYGIGAYYDLSTKSVFNNVKLSPWE